MAHLESCQKDLLSSSGTTSVAFKMRATATISHICKMKEVKDQIPYTDVIILLQI